MYIQLGVGGSFALFFFSPTLDSMSHFLCISVLYKDWKRLTVHSQDTEDEIHIKEWRQFQLAPPPTTTRVELCISSGSSGWWHIGLFDTSYSHWATATDVTGWTYGLSLSTPNWDYLFKAESGNVRFLTKCPYIPFFIFFPFTQVGCRFEC